MGAGPVGLLPDFAHQKAVLPTRIDRTEDYNRNNPTKQFMRTGSVAFDPEVGGRGIELSVRGRELFVEWLRQTYGTVEHINEAWNQGHAGLSLVPDKRLITWQDVSRNWSQLASRKYLYKRDFRRFKVEHSLNRIRSLTWALLAFDPAMPFRGGGELGLFLPSTWYGVDLEGVAGEVAGIGSFYPSMHFSWHFDLVNQEITRPFYMQASLIDDLFKGGWAGGWESNGGPQQPGGERYVLCRSGARAQRERARCWRTKTSVCPRS